MGIENLTGGGVEPPDPPAIPTLITVWRDAHNEVPHLLDLWISLRFWRCRPGGDIFMGRKTYSAINMLSPLRTILHGRHFTATPSQSWRIVVACNRQSRPQRVGCLLMSSGISWETTESMAVCGSVPINLARQSGPRQHLTSCGNTQLIRKDEDSDGFYYTSTP